MEKILFGATTYCPTSPLTGMSGNTLLRAKNIILTGQGTNTYLSCYKGSLDMSENIDPSQITGTLTATLGSTTITGAGTLFTSELRSGQMFYSEDDFFFVNEIIDDTTLTVYRGPTVQALVADIAYRLPVLFEINRQRGTLIQGCALQFDKGTIIGTGLGTLRLNGDPLAGTSMDLTGGPQIAIFDGAGNYAVYSIGFDTPTVAPTLTAIAGGTHGMQAGDYSIRLVPSSVTTNGYSNPGPRANVSLTAADQQIQVDISAVTPDTAAGQDQWDAYGTQLGVVNVNQGPWNFIRSVAIADIVGNVFTLDYLNAEIARQGEMDFDADPPPDSVGFVASLQGNPQWISCFGKWGGSPGPSIVPAQPFNIEAAPAVWNVTTSPPENILGVISSQARLYFLCPNTLQQGVYAPTGDPLIPPTQIRPYWSMGFGNPYQLVFPTTGMLIGYPTGGPTRSIADAEVADEQYIGANVAEITKNWLQPHVLVGYDPDPAVNAICFFYPANEQSEAGFWTTRVLLWGLTQSDWIGDVTLERPTKDTVVCGVATVDNQLYFLAATRFGGSGVSIDTFAWNVEGSMVEVDYYAAWQLQNLGITDRNKTVKAARVNGKITQGRLDIYGFDSDVPEDLTDLESGDNPQVSISVNTATITTTPRTPIVAPNNFVFTARVSGTYNGTDAQPDIINGVVLEAIPSGGRR